jgi:hypothetical protein
MKFIMIMWRDGREHFLNLDSIKAIRFEDEFVWVKLTDQTLGVKSGKSWDGSSFCEFL